MGSGVSTPKAAEEALGAESSPPVMDSSAGGDVGDKAESADASKMHPPPVITSHAACQLIFFCLKVCNF